MPSSDTYPVVVRPDALRTVMNVLWFIFGGGFHHRVQYALVGFLLCLTIVGAPFGVQCFKLAGLQLTPFGREVVKATDSPLGPNGVIALNIVWFLVAGVSIFISHIVLAVTLAISIIGIPFASRT